MTLILGKMLLVLVELSLLLGGLKLLQRTGKVHPELLRKLLHVAMGVTVLSFPWLFDQTWPVLTLAGLAAAGLLSVRWWSRLRGSIGSVINGVGRTSLGEVYYPLAVGVLWLLSGGDELLFGIPMLVLSLADAMAALIGLRYGSIHFQTHDGYKSAEGSTAFFMVAFLSVHVPILLATDIGRVESLLLAVIIGLLVMLLESVAWRGVDNLLVPLGTYAFLAIYLDAPAEALAWRTAVVLTLVVFTLVWRWRSSMDDSALIAGSLVGYAALLIGGWVWLLPPLALFLTHGIAWPRGQDPRTHSVGAVISVTGVGLACQLLEAQHPWAGWRWAYTASFAAHLAIVGVSYLLAGDATSSPRRAARVLLAVALGWGLVFVPVALIVVQLDGGQGVFEIALATLATTVLAAVIFGWLMPVLYGRAYSPSRVHSVGVILAGSAALLNATISWHVLPQAYVHQSEVMPDGPDDPVPVVRGDVGGKREVWIRQQLRGVGGKLSTLASGGRLGYSFATHLADLYLGSSGDRMPSGYQPLRHPP